MRKFRVGILGATGSVGQRFIQLLENHPWFSITALVASDKSSGKSYKEAVRWRLNTPIPKDVASLTVLPAQPDIPCDFVFSGLDSSIAGKVEEEFAQHDYPVISNSKNHRMDKDVPLIIPEVNSDHASLIDIQRKKREYKKGFIVTNPNCSTIGLTIALKPLYDAFGIEKVHVTTLQALSGAGFPGVASMDITDNVIPYIGDEEEKIEQEPLKILGEKLNDTITPANISISAQCTRVAVTDGHTETVSILLRRKAPLEKIAKVIKKFQSIPQHLQLPSAPIHPIFLMDQLDRPQPRLDRDKEAGMAVSIGRLRPCPVFDIKFVVLSHNTIRGAAGAAILNAELLVKQQYIK